jgi:hypothetical protein
MPFVTPEFVAELTQAVNVDVMNRGTDIPLRRYNMPLLTKLWAKRNKTAGHAGGETIHNWSRSDLRQPLQYVTNGLERLNSAKNSVDLRGRFPFKFIFKGLDLIYTDLMDEGNSITFGSGEAGRAMVKKNTPDDKNILWDAMKRKIEEFRDTYMVQLNREFYYSEDPVGLAGIDQLISLDPTAGLIGGLPRATNPELQHIARLGLTTTTGGTLWQGLTQAFRLANTYNRDRPGMVDLVLCGDDALDGLVIWQQNNGLRINSEASGGTKTDPGMSGDEGRFFNGVRFVRDPTLREMDAAGVPDNGVPWSKRIYGICSAGLEIRTPPGMDLQMWSPTDPRDQLFTTTYICSRLALISTIPNSHFVASIA